MKEVIKFFYDYWKILTWMVSCFAGFGVATYIGAKIKLPVIERKVCQQDKDIKNLNQETKNIVHKEELYRKDGRPIYQHTDNCRIIHATHASEMRQSFKDIKSEVQGLLEMVTEVDGKIQTDRTTIYSFMSAVKEKLDLKFTVPKI